MKITQNKHLSLYFIYHTYQVNILQMIQAFSCFMQLLFLEFRII